MAGPEAKLSRVEVSFELSRLEIEHTDGGVLAGFIEGRIRQLTDVAKDKMDYETIRVTMTAEPPVVVGPSPGQQQEHAVLVREIRRHAKLYYNKNDPEISNLAYDEMYSRLQALERECPALCTWDSPTQQVGHGVANPVKRKEGPDG